MIPEPAWDPCTLWDIFEGLDEKGGAIVNKKRAESMAPARHSKDEGNETYGFYLLMKPERTRGWRIPSNLVEKRPKRLRIPTLSAHSGEPKRTGQPHQRLRNEATAGRFYLKAATASVSVPSGACGVCGGGAAGFAGGVSTNPLRTMANPWSGNSAWRS